MTKAHKRLTFALIAARLIAMLTYTNSGFADYSQKPVRIYGRLAWEFQACMTGSIACNLRGQETATPSERTLWVLPKGFPHGWIAANSAERIVFHHTVVPAELERLLPSRGYYRVSLSDSDCDRIRTLAAHGLEIMTQPTELVSLQTRALADELSLMALREVTPQPLSSRSIAHDKSERALAWYMEHIEDAPSYEDIASAVFVSPAHLRRLFHEARGENPQSCFNRARMELVETMLRERDLCLDEIAFCVGLSSASALSRAVKAHFGVSPRELVK
jgi:AraC family transcriptional regulator